MGSEVSSDCSTKEASHQVLPSQFRSQCPTRLPIHPILINYDLEEQKKINSFLCSCVTGTIVDNKVCHPKNNDFYLCAQNGKIVSIMNFNAFGRNDFQ